MKAIYKFNLEVTDQQTITLPVGAELLSVQVQHDRPKLWAVVNPEQGAPTEPVEIMIYGTGHPMGERLDLEFINTFQMQDGGLVFHAFRVRGSR